jgi:hypothetical protein
MDENITAEWARNESDTVLNDKIKAEIIILEGQIMAMVKKNRYEITLYQSIELLTEKSFTDRGFSVTQWSDQREGDTTKISW